ncbi:MAG: MATE family efflux transporter [Limnohabitans sp.]|nr:MATE family efflux transporter [Limnohabitans sp.]
MSGLTGLTTAPILPTIWRLSLPNLLAMVATAMVSVAETTYVGQLGTAALAGMALVFPMVMLQQMLSSGAMGGGISSAISRALGAGNEARANDLVLHAVLISLGLGLLFTVLIGGFGVALFSLFGGQGEALQACLEYAHVAFAGSASLWVTNAFASALRGSGNMKTPSTTLLLVALAQMVIGGVMGLGWGPIPRGGMGGVAMGQVLAFSLGGVYLGWHLLSGQGRVRLNVRTTLRRDCFNDILRVGAVASISSIQTVLTIVILTRIVSSFGMEALAGYGIGTRLEFLLVPITFAIGVACVPMVGMSIGAGLVPRARQVAWTGALLSAVMVGSLGFLVSWFPDQWSRLFTDQAEVIQYAQSYFTWVAPAYPFFALGLCLYFASQGAGRLLGPVLAGTLRLVVVLVGGLVLVQQQAPAWSMFALISAAMVLYGLCTALFVRYTPWGRD